MPFSMVQSGLRYVPSCKGRSKDCGRHLTKRLQYLDVKKGLRPLVLQVHTGILKAKAGALFTASKYFLLENLSDWVSVFLFIRINCRHKTMKMRYLRLTEPIIILSRYSPYI